MSPHVESSVDPFASIVVPTRNRASVLKLSLSSLVHQDYPKNMYEIVVVDNGSGEETCAVVEEFSPHFRRNGDPLIRYVRCRMRGANSARNTGITEARGDPICLVDDDIEAPAGWLRSVVEGVRRNPGAGCYGGPIRLLLEGKTPPLCGGEPLGETELDLGDDELAVDLVFSANMAVTRHALEEVGLFDASIEIYGDEEEWERRLADSGGSIVYLPEAWLWHRRTHEDLLLLRLLLRRFRRGRHEVRSATVTGTPISIRADCQVIPRFLLHGLRRHCVWGLLASSARLGRVWEALRVRFGHTRAITKVRPP
jgi:glycosyltransferase involved in cell wall biosynthesis